MSEYQYRRQLLITPWREGEDLLVYGIKKLKENLKLLSIKETVSPEGAEWTFFYNGSLNRLYIEKSGENIIATGEALPEAVESLKKIIKEKHQD